MIIFYIKNKKYFRTTFIHDLKVTFKLMVEDIL